MFLILAQSCIKHGFMDSSTEKKVNLIIESTTLIPNRVFRYYANGVGMSYLRCEQTNRYKLSKLSLTTSFNAAYILETLFDFQR